MSEDDYLNPAQLAFFKARLEKMEQDLIRNAGQTTENLRETTLVPDPADRATIEEEHALELRTRDRERKLLKKVKQSLASIESGDYGWCVETGEPIGIADAGTSHRHAFPRSATAPRAETKTVR